MNFKKILVILFFTGISFEFCSFVFSYFNLLPVSTTPNLYSVSTYKNFRNEKNIWGAWHKENLKIRHKKECFDVIYETNNIGAKDYNFDYKMSDRGRFILLGDSFAEGFGVSNQFAFKAILEKKLNTEIYNFGSSGALGPVQYYLIYKNLAIQYEHNNLIISFLPANDFNENDYKLWKKKKWNLFDDVERYRPYYIKKGNEFDYFIPRNAKKRDNWYSLDNPTIFQKIKSLVRETSWSFNIYKSFVLIKNYSEKKSIKYSGFFDATAEQQEASMYFFRKILNMKKFDNVYFIIFPTVEDLKRIYLKGDNVYNQKWYKELLKIKNEVNYGFKIINIAEYFQSPEEYKNLLHTCDGHLNEAGNEFVSEILYREIKNLN